jgi:hypothetical protein
MHFTTVYELEFTIVTSVMVIYRVNFHCLVNLNFIMFCEALLRLRKFCQTYNNAGEESIIIWSDSIMFR